MGRLFYNNFDFERRLQTTNDPGRQLRRINQELAFCWLAVAEPDDLILCEEAPPPDFLEHLKSHNLPCPGFVRHPREALQHNIQEFVPWGWSKDMAWWVQELGLKQDVVPAETAFLANSREFSAWLESEWSVGIPHAGPAYSLDELQGWLNLFTREDHSTGWIIKTRLGHAGRERIQGPGRELSQNHLNWVDARLQRDGVLFFEPQVRAIEEVGIQWTIPRAGDPQLDGIVPLLSTQTGGYFGSRIPASSAPITQWNDAVKVQYEALLQLQRLGYRGPAGIDAMRYWLTDTETAIRPLQDINARWTMGRIALHWAKQFKSNGGAWVHATESPHQLAISTSPEFLGLEPVQRRTWWYPPEISAREAELL